VELAAWAGVVVAAVTGSPAADGVLMAGTAEEGTPKTTDRGAEAILIIGDVVAQAILGGIGYLMMRARSDRAGRLAAHARDRDHPDPALLTT
jgi:hypothetical protein